MLLTVVSLETEEQFNKTYYQGCTIVMSQKTQGLTDHLPLL